MQVQIVLKSWLIKIWILQRGFDVNIWEPGFGRQKHTVHWTQSHRHSWCFAARLGNQISRVLDFGGFCNSGKVTQRCQMTGNYPGSVSTINAIFIVLWQIYTQSGTPGLACSPALTNCQGRRAVICLQWGFLRSFLKTCGFTFPLSLQEMAGQWNTE